MTVIKAYPKFLHSGCMRFIMNRYAGLFLFLLFFSGMDRLYSQDLPEYDEISVFLDIPGIGGGEINALIKADKEFEYVSLPGLKHTGGGVYGERKRRDFFVRYLLGVAPPDWNMGEK